MKYLEKFYVEEEGRPADMIVFKPTAVSDEENRAVHRYISLFNYLFSFYRKSVSYMLEKTGDPGIITTFLETAGISDGPDNRFRPDRVKAALSDHAGKNRILDSYLSELIPLEYRRLVSKHRVSLPTTQVSLDLEREKGLERSEQGDVQKEIEDLKNKFLDRI